MSMNFCPNCGNKLVDGQKFCQGCGYALQQEEQTVGVFENEISKDTSQDLNCVNDVEENSVDTNEFYVLPSKDKKTTNPILELVKKKWYFGIVGIVIIILLCVILSKCSTTDVKNNKIEEYGVGDTVIYNDVSITLESVEKYDTTFSMTQPDPGKEFILLWFTVDNAGDEDFSFGSLLGDESLCDGEDVSNAGISLFRLDDEIGEKIMTTIVAGEKKYGYAMYEVNKGFQNFEFIFDPTAMDLGEFDENSKFKTKDDDSIVFKFTYSEVGEATKQFSNSKYGFTSLDDIRDIYKFTLDEKSYALPFKANKLFDLGWEPTLADAHTDTLDSATYSIYTLKKGIQTIDVAIANATSETAVLYDCMVMEIGITKDSGVAFETSDGFKIGDSYKEVYEKYGAEEYSGSDGGIGDKQLQYEFLRDLLSDGRLTSIGSTNNMSDKLTIQWNDYENITSIKMNLVLFD